MKHPKSSAWTEAATSDQLARIANRRSGTGLRQKNRRRGSTYILVVGIAIIAMSVSMAAMALSQAQRRAKAIQVDQQRATWLGQAAIQQALAQISDEPDWRNQFAAYQNTTFSPEVLTGSGKFSWQLHDPIDGQITNNRADPVRIIGKSSSGYGRRAFSVLAIENSLPLDVLRSAVHAEGELKIMDAAIVGYGPVSTNDHLQLSQAELFGAAEANTIDFLANITGIVSTSAAPKKMPTRLVFDVYRQIATKFEFGDIPTPGLRDRLITPVHPPTVQSTNNSAGVYFVRVPAGDELLIENTRVDGTLVVLLDGASATMRIGQGVVWKPYREDYPALIVKTLSDTANQVTIECGGVLDEDAASVNFNPDDAPYFNSSNTSTDDSFQASLRGLFHVIREIPSPQSKTTVIASNKFVGCIIAEGELDISGVSHLQANHDFMTTPPIGYTMGLNPGELLGNGNMDTQIAPWIPVGATSHGGGTRLQLVSPANDGSYGIEISQRASAAAGIAQDLTNRVENDEDCEGSFWIKLLEQDEDIRISLEIRTATSLQTFTKIESAQTDWSEIEFKVKPIWSGDLESARLIICTTESNQAFQIDQATIEDKREIIPSPLYIFDSTWQQEPYPQ